MLVAATAMFKGTLDRPRGAALLRDLANMLERQGLKQIPWGQTIPITARPIQRLIDRDEPPSYEPGDDDAMLKLMADLEQEFVDAVERRVDRYLEAVETADEQVLYESFTYNKRVNRLATIQEHYMIVRVLERGVPEEKLACELNVDAMVIRQRRHLLAGRHPEFLENFRAVVQAASLDQSAATSV
jgi:hypothetical protein